MAIETVFCDVVHAATTNLGTDLNAIRDLIDEGVSARDSNYATPSSLSNWSLTCGFADTVNPLTAAATHTVECFVRKSPAFNPGGNGVPQLTAYLERGASDPSPVNMGTFSITSESSGQSTAATFTFNTSAVTVPVDQLRVRLECVTGGGGPNTRIGQIDAIEIEFDTSAAPSNTAPTIGPWVTRDERGVGAGLSSQGSTFTVAVKASDAQTAQANLTVEIRVRPKGGAWGTWNAATWNAGTADYRWAWNTTGLTDGGVYELQARATDDDASPLTTTMADPADILSVVVDNRARQTGRYVQFDGVVGSIMWHAEPAGAARQGPGPQSITLLGVLPSELVRTPAANQTLAGQWTSAGQQEKASMMQMLAANGALQGITRFDDVTSGGTSLWKSAAVMVTSEPYDYRYTVYGNHPVEGVAWCTTERRPSSMTSGWVQATPTLDTVTRADIEGGASRFVLGARYTDGTYATTDTPYIGRIAGVMFWHKRPGETASLLLYERWDLAAPDGDWTMVGGVTYVSGATPVDAAPLTTTADVAAEINTAPLTTTVDVAAQADANPLTATAHIATAVDATPTTTSAAVAFEVDAAPLTATASIATEAGAVDAAPLTSTASVAAEVDSATLTSTTNLAAEVDSAPLTATADVAAEIDTAPLATTANVKAEINTAPLTTSAAIALEVDATPLTSTANVAAQVDATPLTAFASVDAEIAAAPLTTTTDVLTPVDTAPLTTTANLAAAVDAAPLTTSASMEGAVDAAPLTTTADIGTTVRVFRIRPAAPGDPVGRVRDGYRIRDASPLNVVEVDASPLTTTADVAAEINTTPLTTAAAVAFEVAAAGLAATADVNSEVDAANLATTTHVAAQVDANPLTATAHVAAEVNAAPLTSTASIDQTGEVDAAPLTSTASVAAEVDAAGLATTTDVLAEIDAASVATTAHVAAQVDSAPLAATAHVHAETDAAPLTATADVAASVDATPLATSAAVALEADAAPLTATASVAAEVDAAPLTTTANVEAVGEVNAAPLTATVSVAAEINTAALTTTASILTPVDAAGLTTTANVTVEIDAAPLTSTATLGGAVDAAPLTTTADIAYLSGVLTILRPELGLFYRNPDGPRLALAAGPRRVRFAGWHPNEGWQKVSTPFVFESNTNIDVMALMATAWATNKNADTTTLRNAINQELQDAGYRGVGGADLAP